MYKHRKTTWLIDLGGWFIFLLAIYTLFLGSYPLGVPDESRYCEIPREMVLAHDYITPHLNGFLYFEKPVLFYWIQSLALKTLGMGEWAMRFPTALLASLGCLMTYTMGRYLFGRVTGLLATLILASSLLYFAMGHLITLDMTVTVLLTGSLYSTLLAIKLPKGWQQGGAILAACAFAGLATLTKGLIGIFFPVVISFSWLLIYRQWQLLKSAYFLWGILLFLIIVLPWHLTMQYLHPDFFHFYFLEQQFLRYLTMAAARYQPAWFFIPILLIGLFPWSGFLPQALYYHWQKRNPDTCFLLLWVGLVFLFFSFSKSKLIPYILPLFPPLALLLAQYLKEQLHSTRGLMWGWYLTVTMAIGIGIALMRIPANHQVNHYQHAIIGLYSLSAILLLGSGMAMLVFKRKHFTASWFCLGGMSLIAWLTLTVTIAAVDNRTIKPLAIILKPLVKATDIVASYHTYYQDLPFYLQKRVVIVDWHNELEFGMNHGNTKAWVYDNPRFWSLWQGPKTIYMVASREMYQRLQTTHHGDLYLVSRTAQDVLLTNHR